MKLDDTLTRLGWRRVDLARRLGIKPETVSRWGQTPPRYAQAYLAAALLVHDMREKINRFLS